MNPTKMTSSFSKREMMRRNPFNRRNNRSTLLRRRCMSLVNFFDSTHSRKGTTTCAIQEDGHPAEAASSSNTRRGFTSRFLVCAVPFLASIATLPPVGAHEGHGDSHGFFDTVSSLLKRSDSSSVNVPKRRKSTTPSHAHTHDTVDREQVTVQPSPEVARVIVPKRLRLESVQPLLVPAPVAVSGSEPRVSVQPLPAPAPVAVSGSEPRVSVQPLLVPAPVAVSGSEPRALVQPLAAVTPVDASRDHEGVQPFHVLRAVQDLIAEVTILREALGIRDYPPEAEFVDGRAPIHVYAKSLEVLDKVLDTQRRSFVPVGRAGQIPLKEIDDGDVLANIEYILIELRKIKSRMGINRRIEPAPLNTGTTSSMNYKSLADASFMLDGLRGRTITPNDVYQNTVFILNELVLVAKRFNTPLSYELAPVEGTMKTIDVALQILRARYKVVDLQTMLGMDASSVPAMTLARVTPSENYDATNLVLAEIARIKLHAGVNQPSVARPERSTGNGSNDAFAVIELINRNLDTLAAAVSG